MTGGPVGQETDVDPRSTGKQIEALLDSSAADGPLARERAEELVRLVVDLYSAGLERLLDLVDEAGGLDGGLLARLAGDDLVASLLLVAGLHPYGVEERVARALDSVRPYLGSHGGDVELLGVDKDGSVRLRLLGSCDGCPSSAVTLELAVRDAITAAAPEVTGLDVLAAEPVAGRPAGFVPLSSLTARLHDETPDAGPASGTVWHPLDELPDLESGDLRHLFLDGVPVLVCRLPDALYAYRDVCPVCASDFTSAPLTRQLGSNAPLLTCPGCRRHFDVRRAGAGIEPDAGHLDPLPILVRDGATAIAVPHGALT